MKDGSILAKNVLLNYLAKEKSARIAYYTLIMCLRKENVNAKELSMTIASFLIGPHKASKIISRNIRNFILKKKVKKWGRGVFLNTMVTEEDYCYFPATECYLWKTINISQEKYVSHCSECQYKFKMGPHYIDSLYFSGSLEYPDFELIEAFCHKCWVSPENYFKSPEYKLNNNRTKTWSWPTREILLKILYFI